MNPIAGDATRSDQVPVSATLADVEFPISPAPDAVEFWDGVERGELMLPWCGACEAPFWYPRTACPRCGDRTTDWVPSPGRGTVHAFCITHQPLVAHLRDRVPYVTALVDLDEDVRMMGLLDVAPDPSAVHVGMGVVVEFVPTATRKIPRFRPRPEGDRP